MTNSNPYTGPDIVFAFYKINHKARDLLKDYQWGSRAKTFQPRNGFAKYFNAWTNNSRNDDESNRNRRDTYARAKYIKLKDSADSPKKGVPSKKVTSKPAVKGGLGSSKKEDPPVKELKKIMAKESVKEAPKEINRQTVFQPRGKRKQIRNPFTGNRPTL